MINKTILTIIIPTYNRVEELKISIPNLQKINEMILNFNFG